MAVATVRDAPGDCDWKDLVLRSARESDALPPREETAPTVASGFSFASSLLAPAAIADGDLLGWCRGCDKRDRIDGSGIRPEWEDLNDLAEFAPVADAVDDPVGGDDVSAVPDSEEGLVFAAGPELGDPESGDDPCEVVDPPSSAAAIPGLLAIAAPTPSATANAPILPINRPQARFSSLECGVVANCGVLSVFQRSAGCTPVPYRNTADGRLLRSRWIARK